MAQIICFRPKSHLSRCLKPAYFSWIIKKCFHFFCTNPYAKNSNVYKIEKKCAHLVFMLSVWSKTENLWPQIFFTGPKAQHTSVASLLSSVMQICMLAQWGNLFDYALTIVYTQPIAKATIWVEENEWLSENFYTAGNWLSSGHWAFLPVDIWVSK